ncbi:peptide/nickel transport system substrate-binding protein/oligopeptide transport system substrate-binding protein [Lentibacillus persicus]|uniref:Peptide/nickel transport system substrate-binding protein/oligopeptide transport system substrate-binding protein n=1 Tax=Lentibacillus persicus TaxID=640948 RepID=A0A1I2A1A3_9BACI|nr:peptide ABC transporter substrate-binding protein [Lentibacillus persicus]SFE37547.1 peptide/nickel transport system substrate-binding protein/oligopeptide transport system substrate-binding protein [Lentibacillus persicus]
MNDIRKILPVLLLALIMLAACSGEEQEESAAGNNANTNEEKVVQLSAPGEIPGLDPVMADNNFSFNVINQVFEGLYRLDEDGKPQLAMAASEPEVTDDNRVYTFEIREDATWSDGSPVTADDFEYAWKKAVNPETGAAYGPQFEEIVAGATEILIGEKPVDELGVEALNEKTLQVTLEEPVPYFKDLLTTATFFPQPEAFIEEQGEKYATTSEHTLYNGPFVLEDWNGTGNTWTYAKNDTYWDKEAVNVDKIEVNVVKDTQTAVDLYENDQLARVDLTGEFVDQYGSDDAYHTFLTGGVRFLKMNQGKDGETTDLANLNIRKALNMALDRDVIANDILNNGSEVLYGTVPRGVAENPETGEDFREENGPLMHYDVEQAKEHWQKGLEELGKDELEFALTTSDSSSSVTVAENLKHQWESALEGLTVTVKNVPPEQSVDANVNQNYELILTGWSGDYQDPMTYLNLFITDSPGNHTGYSDEAYDELVLKSKSSLADKPMERWNALLEAERKLIEESAVLVPLYQSGTAYLQKDNVTNFHTYKVSADNYKWIDIAE